MTNFILRKLYIHLSTKRAANYRLSNIHVPLQKDDVILQVSKTEIAIFLDQLLTLCCVFKNNTLIITLLNLFINTQSMEFNILLRY